MHLRFAPLALLVVLPLNGQAPGVLSVSPSNEEVGASPAAAILIEFDRPLDPATVTGENVRVFGRWSGPVPGELELDPFAQVLVFRPLRPYFPAERVNVYVSGSLSAAGGDGLEGGFTSAFWVRAAPSSGSFSTGRVIDLRKPGESAIAAYGVYGGDVNGDGWPDITAMNEFSQDIRVLLGGCAPFTSMTTITNPGHGPSPSEAADFNGDGLLDLVTGNRGDAAISVYLGNGSGYRAPMNFGPAGFTHGIAVLDVDGDGDTDVAAPDNDAVLIFVNDGDGTMTHSLSIDTGANEDNVGAADVNGDGIADLYVGNYGTLQVTVLLGDGQGGFSISSSVYCGGRPFHMAVGDVDGDGIADAAVANWESDTFGLLRGDGVGGLLPPVTYPVGKSPVAIDLGDLDGDGDLDCVTSSFRGADYTIYWNDGSGVFGNPVSIPAPAAGSCATLMDFDRDGDTDMVLTDEVTDQLLLLVQDGPVPAGVESPHCGGTLLVNDMAARAGFAGAPAHPLPLGEYAFLGISGKADAAYALVLGVAAEPGLAIPSGTVNLDPLQPVILLANGFAGDVFARLDKQGETTLRLHIAETLPPGIEVTLQALVGDPDRPLGIGLTNPETVVFVR